MSSLPHSFSNIVRRSAPLALPAILALAVLVGTTVALRAPLEARMSRAASAFLSTLGEAQRTKACFAFDSPVRKDWHYIPLERPGLALGELDDQQRVALHALLTSALATQGYLKVTGIVHLEAILREIESTPGHPATLRDPGRYMIAIFGVPGNGAWGWRFEGHHISLNFCSIEGEGDTHTPFFLGSNPERVPSGAEAGWRVLAREEDLGRELFVALDGEQRQRAVLAGAVPGDVILGPGRDGGFEKAEGLAYADMRAPERAVLERILAEFIDDLSPELAAREWERVKQKGMENIRFAWCGGVKIGEPHYWRLQGPHFVIEYDDTQGGANHVHTLWRDLENDFGGDLLQRHYAQEHAPTKR
jgi:hypothetical protein